MKPSEHPEFFRLPPPEGRSRESTIVLTRAGRFFHQGAPVEHPGMHQAFASWLTRHPDDGRFILSNGYDWTYLTVEGPAYFVRAVRSAGTGLEVELLDATSLPLDPAALTSDADGRLWLRLADGRAACFTAAAQLELAPYLVERNGGFGVELGGQFWAIPDTSVGEVPPVGARS
jgi:uncharacterized protein